MMKTPPHTKKKIRSANPTIRAAAKTLPMKERNVLMVGSRGGEESFLHNLKQTWGGH